jgi:NADH-quinone oxidoreductase subunit D
MAEKTIEFQPDIDFDVKRDEIGDLQTEEMLINMGPQHPATHGVLRVVLRTDGEIVMEATPYIGYLHRCAEKIGENLQPYQWIPKTDRLDYLAAMNNNHTFALAVEQLCGIDVPERGKYVRVIASELNRIASHLVSFGCYGMDMGAFTPFLYGFREREYILDLFEAMCGARLTYSYIYPGGPSHDLPEGWVERCREFLDYFEPKIDEYNNLLSFNHIFVNRTANVVVTTAEQAIAYGLSGPPLRACGVRWDLRRSRPYDIYDRFDFEIPIGLEGGHDGIPDKVVPGDSWNRYFVRMLEMKQSVRIVRQALDQMPTDGPVAAKNTKNVKLPKGSIYFEAENPRGQLGFYIEGDGSRIPYRVKCKGPSFCNLSITSEACRGVLIADMPAFIGSIDIVMGEVDR